MSGDLGVLYRGKGHSLNKISDKTAFSCSATPTSHVDYIYIYIYIYILDIEFIKNFFNLNIYYNSGIFNQPTAARMTVVSIFITN